MSPVLNFPNQIPYSGNRPYADVVLLGAAAATAPAPTHKCLVDTGADYLQLPASAVSAALLAGGTPAMVSTVAGAATLTLVKNITVSIENCQVTVDALFDHTNSTIPIAGRQLLLAAFEMGFRANDWLWV